MTAVMIGLPVFNGGETLAAALDSILAQSFQDFTIFISDNASTDDTLAICRDYATRDLRIQFESLPTNLTAVENYSHVLARANTPYFMWAAADDLWAPAFVETHHRFLVAHPDYVLSQSRVLFRCAGKPTRLAIGTYPLRGTPRANAACFFANPADNSRFYGLCRTEALQKCYPEGIFHGHDWIVSGATLRFGKHHEVPEILMVRDETSPLKYKASVKLFAHKKYQRYLPMLPMTSAIFRGQLVPMSVSLAWSLFWLNLRIGTRYASFGAHEWLLRSADRKSRSIWTARAAELLALGLSPGLSERLQTVWTKFAKKMSSFVLSKGVVFRGADDIARSPKRLDQKEFGWTAPQALRSRQVEISVLTVLSDELPNALRMLDQIPLAMIDAESYEIVMVDNASTDATEIVLRDRSEFKYLRPMSKLALSAAVDLAVEATDADILVLVDPKVLLHERTIGSLVALLQDADLAVALVAGQDSRRCDLLDRVEGNRGIGPFAFALRRATLLAVKGGYRDMSTFSEVGTEIMARIRASGGRCKSDQSAIVTLPSDKRPLPR
jgi:glycosyltransferase involved in cell wall biosynthesis